MHFKIIVATCNNNGIGIDNKLPWECIKEDMKIFSKLTIGNHNNAIIMGRKTFESIGQPLKNRTNIILSNSLELNKNNLISFNNIDNIIKYCNEKAFEECWIIGGSIIYQEFLKMNIVTEIYQTKVYKNYVCDTYFPEISYDFNINNFIKIKNNDPSCVLIHWTKNLNL